MNWAWAFVLLFLNRAVHIPRPINNVKLSTMGIYVLDAWAHPIGFRSELRAHVLLCMQTELLYQPRSGNYFLDLMRKHKFESVFGTYRAKALIIYRHQFLIANSQTMWWRVFNANGSESTWESNPMGHLD